MASKLTERKKPLSAVSLVEKYNKNGKGKKTVFPNTVMLHGYSFVPEIIYPKDSYLTRADALTPVKREKITFYDGGKAVFEFNRTEAINTMREKALADHGKGFKWLVPVEKYAIKLNHLFESSMLVSGNMEGLIVWITADGQGREAVPKII